jgi:hypothetical protein
MTSLGNRHCPRRRGIYFRSRKGKEEAQRAQRYLQKNPRGSPLLRGKKVLKYILVPCDLVVKSLYVIPGEAQRDPEFLPNRKPKGTNSE